MCVQTQFIFTQKLEVNWLLGLVFFSTFFIYALHRIIGLSKASDFLKEGRYAVIQKFKNHILLYAVIAFLASVFCFFKIDRSIQTALILPAIISLGYILPIYRGKKRLRDFNHIKIFLIAITWGYVTVFLPALISEIELNYLVGIMVIERALFVFAFTLPFDIRDLQVDARNAVQTIPAAIGAAKTIRLAMGLLGIAFLMSVIIWSSGIYTNEVLLAMLLSYGSTIFFVSQANRFHHDYYFTGLLDGTMLIQFILILVSSYFA